MLFNYTVCKGHRTERQGYLIPLFTEDLNNEILKDVNDASFLMCLHFIVGIVFLTINVMKKRKAYIFGGLLFVASMLVSCGSSEVSEVASHLSISSFNNSGCKSTNLDDSRATDMNNEEKIMFKAMADNHISIVHVNALLNCCGEFETEVTWGDKPRTIVINEKDINGPLCDCVCNYDLATEFGRLEKGKYTVVMMQDGRKYFSFDIDYSSKLDGTVVVKHSVE